MAKANHGIPAALVTDRGRVLGISETITSRAKPRRSSPFLKAGIAACGGLTIILGFTAWAITSVTPAHPVIHAKKTGADQNAQIQTLMRGVFATATAADKVVPVLADTRPTDPIGDLIDRDNLRILTGSDNLGNPRTEIFTPAKYPVMTDEHVMSDKEAAAARAAYRANHRRDKRIDGP